MALGIEDIAKQCSVGSADVKDAVDFLGKKRLCLSAAARLLFLNRPQASRRRRFRAIIPKVYWSKRQTMRALPIFLDEIQRILGKSVNHNDASVVFAMYDHLGFSADLILQIINYCVKGGKTNFRYIEKGCA